MDEPPSKSQLIGIVGPCGSGKSTLIERLEKHGFTCQRGVDAGLDLVGRAHRDRGLGHHHPVLTGVATDRLGDRQDIFKVGRAALVRRCPYGDELEHPMAYAFGRIGIRHSASGEGTTMVIRFPT